MAARRIWLPGDRDEDDDSRIWENAAGGAAFSPLDSGKVTGWLRLAVSQQSGGEWTPSIVDVLNPGAPMVQTDVDRRAAVGVSGNGYPTMVFDGTDVHRWPSSPAMVSTTKQGLFFWYKPATIVGFQLLFVQTTLGSHKRIDVYQHNANLVMDAYITDANGRSGETSSAALTAGAWHAIYAQYDSSRGGDANSAILVGGVSKALSFINVGAGGTLGALQSSTGDILVGGNADSDTPGSPIANLGEIGPNILVFNDNLTAAEEAAVRGFEAPT